MSGLFFPPSQNGLQKTLGAQLDQGFTTSATFNNTTGVQNAKGLFVVDRIDTNGVEKDAAVREYISFDGTSGSTVTTLVRGLGGTSDQDHAINAVVEFVSDVVQQQAILDTLGNLVNTTTGAVDTTKVVTPTGTQTLTNKNLTATTNSFTAASTTQAGVSEIATGAETTTGTDATRAVSPDGLAGSDYGKRTVIAQVVAPGTDTATGDGKAFFIVPSILNGYNLVAVSAAVYTAGTTNTTDVQIRNVTDSVDMLSTKITIDSTEVSTATAATPAVIDTTKDDVATNDRIAIDVDAVSTTAAKGLVVTLTFQLP